MVGAEDRLVNGQRPLVGLPRPRQVAQLLQHRAQVVDQRGHVGMLGAQDRLVNVQRSLVGLPRPRQVGDLPQVVAQFVEQSPRSLPVFSLGPLRQVPQVFQQRRRHAVRPSALIDGPDTIPHSVGHGGEAFLLCPMTGELGQQTVQSHPAIRFQRHQPQRLQARQSVVEGPLAPDFRSLGVFGSLPPRLLQQLPGDDHTRRAVPGQPEHPQRQRLRWIVGVQAIVAHPEGGGHVLDVLRGRRVPHPIHQRRIVQHRLAA